jgi:transposase
VSLRPQPDFAIPEETRRAAHAAFPKGTLCLRIADELGLIYLDNQFAALFPTRGQPAASPVVPDPLLAIRRAATGRVRRG